MKLASTELEIWRQFFAAAISGAVLRKDRDGINYGSDEVVEFAEYVANGAMETYRAKRAEAGFGPHQIL